MKKKFLTTPEEILALKETDTKIYCDKGNGYYQFINGNLVAVYENSFLINPWVCPKDKPYILVEEPVKEATKEDIGMLCWFWSGDLTKYMVGILCEVDEEEGDCHYCMECSYSCWYEHCRRLTPAEVAEITDYKVEEEL